MKEETVQKHIERIKEDEKRHGISDQDLSSMFLDGMFGKGKMTNSRRIMKIAEIAYFRGMMRGVRFVKDAETQYVLRNGELIEVPEESPTEHRMARTLFDIEQSPHLIPNIIPKDSLVEVIREVEHPDFYSGKGYLIFWKEKCYSDVVDSSRLEFI